MATHVVLKNQAQASLVQAFVDLTASLSAKDLARPSADALRMLLEGLLGRMSVSRDPLARARLRGLIAQRELLEGEGGTLTSSEMAAALGVSRQAIDKRRRAGHLLAFEVAKRGYLYPAWQLTSAGLLLPGLVDVLEALPNDSPWADARFFLSGNLRLRNGRRPLDLLRRGEIEPVVRAAGVFGEHGAA